MPNFPKGTGQICAICGKPQANATCVQCGAKVCPSHSNYINGKTYCLRCKIVCPKCHSEHITLQKRGFNLGNAVGKWLVGGIFGVIHEGLASTDTELVCMACGYKWKPNLKR